MQRDQFAVDCESGAVRGEQSCAYTLREVKVMSLLGGSRLIVLALVATLQLVFGWAAEASAETACRVDDPTGTPLNVRTTPNGRIVGALANGDFVSLLDRASDTRGRLWVYVGTTDNKPIGWVYADFIACGNEKVESLDHFLGVWGLLFDDGKNNCGFRMIVSARSTEDPEGRCKILNAKILDQLGPPSAELDLACEHDEMSVRMKEFWYLRTIDSRKHLIVVLPPNNEAKGTGGRKFSDTAPSVFVYQRCE
jgi:Bacterial SH3 domain